MTTKTAWLQAAPRASPNPSASNRIPSRRVELGSHDRDHPADGKDQGDDPEAIHRFAPQADVGDRHQDRVGVEAEQGERDGDPVEGDEHADVERESHDRRDREAQAGATVEVAGPHDVAHLVGRPASQRTRSVARQPIAARQATNPRGSIPAV